MIWYRLLIYTTWYIIYSDAHSTKFLKYAWLEIELDDWMSDPWKISQGTRKWEWSTYTKINLCWFMRSVVNPKIGSIVSNEIGCNPTHIYYIIWRRFQRWGWPYRKVEVTGWDPEWNMWAFYLFIYFKWNRWG